MFAVAETITVIGILINCGILPHFASLPVLQHNYYFNTNSAINSSSKNTYPVCTDCCVNRVFQRIRHAAILHSCWHSALHMLSTSQTHRGGPLLSLSKLAYVSLMRGGLPSYNIPEHTYSIRTLYPIFILAQCVCLITIKKCIYIYIYIYQKKQQIPPCVPLAGHIQ